MAIESINPATGTVMATFTPYTAAEVSAIIEAVAGAQRAWRKVPFSVRTELMHRAATVLRTGIERYAREMTLEMGKPLKQASAEVEKCAWVCEYYASNAEEFLKPEMTTTDASESFIRFDPIGVVLAVMPWNFPFWQVFRFAAPALMAGNGCLLKHASNVPRCALLIEDVFRNAGFPDDIFRTLLIESKAVDGILGHPDVAAATLTGSDPAGRAVAATCGSVLKKTVLELGGSDPFIVLADADIGAAATTAVTARLINNGQSCIAAKRFIVVSEAMPEFRRIFVELVKQQVVGDPMDEHTTVGPLARMDLVDDLAKQVTRSVEMGAEILCGGIRPALSGSYYLPTVLGGVRPGMPAFDEETFGPVAALIEAVDEIEAVELANRSLFGLGASLWTSDTGKAKRIASQLETGSVFINGMVKSDPRLPFGGVKLSGYGRELSHYGMKEFVNIKSVWIK